MTRYRLKLSVRKSRELLFCGCTRRAFGGAAAKPSTKKRTVEPGPDFSHFLRAAAVDQGASSSARTKPPETFRALVHDLLEAEAKDAGAGGRVPPALSPRASVNPMLVDSYGRSHNYLRISLTERCNLRCVYCMPEDGVALQPQAKMLTGQEISRVAALFAAAGVDKVRLTGGEPLLRKDLLAIISAIRGNPGVRNVGITTNGMLLTRQLEELTRAGLTHINLSLDTLNAEKFSAITRRPPQGLQRVREALNAALSAGYGGRLKINCVVMGGVNDHEMGDFLAFAESEAVDVRFIEWMPFDDNGWSDARFMPFDEMLANVRRSQPALERIADGPNDTTKWFQVPGHVGRVGFITSMSQHFCGSCNRLRVTADGSLKVCLFGDESLSLRDAMRAGLSDSELQVLVRAAVRGKKFALGGHGDMYGIAASKNRPMITIGG